MYNNEPSRTGLFHAGPPALRAARGLKESLSKAQHSESGFKLGSAGGVVLVGPGVVLVGPAPVFPQRECVGGLTAFFPGDETGAGSIVLVKTQKLG